MINPQRVIDRNEKVWNKRGRIKRDLELNMLWEELSETAQAAMEQDKVGQVDWLIDLIFVAIWTLYKAWLDADLITRSFEEVCRSNESKLPYKKNKQGKVVKSANYMPPDLSFIVNK